MANQQKPNKPLFSQHYLDHRLQDCPEWAENVAVGFNQLNSLYLSKKDLLPSLSEAQTEEIFIKPALEILGFSYITQVKNRGKGRTQRPDYALFDNESDRDAAFALQNDETAFYPRVKAIAEAKYWERPLSKVSANDNRDIYKNENPSFQITNYLTGTGVDWGILTNGREWRLYYRQASSTATEFYPVDLVELLENAAPDRVNKLDQFKYFWLFFRQEAFVKDSQGRNFLERVREGSTTYATRVGNELKALVFDRLFPDLAGGFVANASRQKKAVEADKVYQATLSFLYKLLFLLYAEARNLLPIDGDYRDYSLIQLTQEVAQSIDTHKKLSQTSTAMYDRLLSLFQIVDRGDSGLGVPRYNGGLFHFDFYQPEDSSEHRANHFLSQFKIADAVIAPVLDRLARFEGQPIDYSFLGVRQLGSIYEGLLEYRLKIEDTATGKVYLENDKGERKATGSYYTPEYIVKYIVSHTIKPILQQRKERFEELMGQIAQLRDRLKDQRLGQQSLRGLQKDLQRLEREAQSTLLDIKVCDPAMGSGHFLVEAVDYLTDELSTILSEYPEHNPVLEMLDQTRESILNNLAQQSITINPDRLEPTQLLQRVVMKRCIYGVDLNPMAVELAKVSLWLHSFTIGAPLSFLDHHLRCGNSLIGTTAREAEAKMMQEESGQFNLLTGPFVGLLTAAEIMRGVSVLSDATFAEVEQSERLFRSFDEAAKPYKRLLDIYVSQFFGVKEADKFLRVYGTDAITANPEKMKKPDKTVYQEAQKISEEKRFFHWDLEFPEVFIDLENASWHENAGFDAVVGNPPYINAIQLNQNLSVFEKPYWKNQFKSAAGAYDIYIIFVEKGINLVKKNGISGMIIPNKFLSAPYAQAFREYIINHKHFLRLLNVSYLPIFADPSIYPVVSMFQSSTPNQEYEIIIESMASNFKATSIVHQRSSYLSKLPDCIWGFLISNFLELALKIESQSVKLEQIAVVNASSTAAEADAYSQALVDRKNEHCIKFINTGLIDRWTITWGIETLTHQRVKILTPYLDMSNSVISAKRKSQYKNPKIIFSKISKYPEVFCDLLGEYASANTNFAYKSDYSLGYLSAILNSHLIAFVYDIYFGSLVMSGGYFQFQAPQLKTIPIRKINFTTPSDRRQQALENTINLYQQYQKNGQLDPLLTQVNHHLNQQPEEADVIHDLLAYLAEQMLELNKQKQAEIKGFLQWLERFIGYPIDNLTNKSKIQNYLRDYYKEELHLSFDEFIEILKKNKKKINIDPVARKDQQTLAKEYQASLDILLPIKTQLMRCDRLIDAIVYQLYGLTDKEIAIVEGKSETH